ncbi:jg14443 [Pararge aegeria aegeria]|uniref:Jg14443 protein n=1 Tax=Pararge aegeria aegeria TaxID=348720 RepID=A0A8S4S132_9NEOP|nr:jg14443 [Pararge aegeria aegeria]
MKTVMFPLFEKQYQKKFLHFCDSEASAGSTDKMFKVLADVLIKKFFQWGVVHEHLSIDESMLKYFGRHPAKQFIRASQFDLDIRLNDCKRRWLLLCFLFIAW